MEDDEDKRGDAKERDHHLDQPPNEIAGHGASGQAMLDSVDNGPVAGASWLSTVGMTDHSDDRACEVVDRSQPVLLLRILPAARNLPLEPGEQLGLRRCDAWVGHRYGGCDDLPVHCVASGQDDRPQRLILRIKCLREMTVPR